MPPTPEGFFLSGPFRPGGFLARHLATAVLAGPRIGATVREKHGGVSEPAIELIMSSEAALLAYGVQRPPIEDVFGRSLVEMELRALSTVARRPAIAILVGRDEHAEPHLAELRCVVRHNLEGAVFEVESLYEDGRPFIPDENASFPLGLDLRAAAAERYDLVPPDLPELIKHHEPLARTLDRGGPTQFRRKLRVVASALPSMAEIDDLVERFEVFALDWRARARPVLDQRVFVSYSRKDQRLAEIACTCLEQAGYEPWIDREGVRIGDDLEKRIFPAMDHCGAVLLLGTLHSAASDWVQREAEQARVLQRRWGELGFALLPTRSPNLPLDAFPSLGGLHQEALDPSDDPATQLERIVKVIEEHRKGE